LIRQTVTPALALFAAALSLSCGQAILTAPIGATLAVNINPPFIAAHGDTAVVSVLVLEPAGTPVPDNTVVQFFTTIGIIDEQGKTNDGVARVNLRSDANSGTARVSVFSGPATATAEVIIGATRPSRVIYGPIDSRIDLKTGRNTARFKVTVLDASGNGVMNVPVLFTVVDSPATDTIHGADSFTDNSGNAFASVQTRRLVSGTIRIRADVLSGTAISTEFTIPVVE
jgi:hypothetical protein